MASNNKKKKLKNSYCVPGELKNKSKGPKRIAFYTSSMRRMFKKIKPQKMTGVIPVILCYI